MKHLIIGLASVALLAGSASAQMTRHDYKDMSRHDNRALRRIDSRFFYGGRSYNRIRGAAWVAPRGWDYRRFVVGAYLPQGFLTPAYVVDPFAFGFGLRPAPAGARWVRVGDDMLLVNWRTGRVIEVIPDVFY